MSSRSLLTLLLAVLLTACQVRPLYLDQSASGGAASPLADVRAIRISPPRDRTEQVIRNELNFLFRGDGSQVEDPRYTLRLLTQTSENSLAVELEEDLPSVIFINVSTTFILADAATERTLLTGLARAGASYDFSSQRFANERAERNALARAGKTVAENINARVTSYFAARKDG